VTFPERRMLLPRRLIEEGLYEKPRVGNPFSAHPF
jgi:hypothetical protein